MLLVESESSGDKFFYRKKRNKKIAFLRYTNDLSINLRFQRKYKKSSVVYLYASVKIIK